MNFKTKLLIVSVFLSAIALSGCDDNVQPTTQQRESAAQDKVQAESNASVGMPNILNFTEKRTYKEIFEKRDEPNLQTFTYLVSEQTMAHAPLCRSIGYGIPESEQYTNPSTVSDFGGSQRYAFEVIPQADPNALYSSPSANGTWVLCLFKDTKVLPVRSEPNVLTLPEPWGQLNQDGM